MNYALSGVPDSTDPGSTYYAYMWNFSRLYAPPLLTFKPHPAHDGLKLIPRPGHGMARSARTASPGRTPSSPG